MISKFVTTGDLSGRRFGGLVVISFAGTTPHAEWVCQCDCGNTRRARATRLVGGLISSCASCAKRAAAAKSGKAKEIDAETAAVNGILGAYRGNARRKGLAFEIQREDVARLISGNCHYCGAAPSGLFQTKNRSRSFAYNGIDRKNNSEGYTASNAVSCCAPCNYAKREMSAAEFIALANRIAGHAK